MAYADALPATPPAPRADNAPRSQPNDPKIDDKEFAKLVDAAPDKSMRDAPPKAKPTQDDAAPADPAAAKGKVVDSATGKSDGKTAGKSESGKSEGKSDDKPKSATDAASTDAKNVDPTKTASVPALMVQFVVAPAAKQAGAADGAATSKGLPAKVALADDAAPVDDAAAKAAAIAAARAAAIAAATPASATAPPAVAAAAVATTTPPDTAAAQPKAASTGAAPLTAATAAATAAAATTATTATTATKATKADKTATPTSDKTTADATGPGANRAEAKGDAQPVTGANGQAAQGQAQAQAAAQAGDPTVQAQTSSDKPSKPDLAIDVAKAAAASATADASATNLAASGSASRSGATQSPGASAPATAAQAAPATMQVAARFIERFDGRAQRFEVRLDPAELGRVDVRIEVGADKKVHAVLAAHDSAALSDLMRGSRALEKALGDAGVDVADGGLKFELATDAGNFSGGQNRSNAWTGGDQPSWPRGQSSAAIPVDVDTAALATTSATRSGRGASRLDLVA